MSSPGGRVETIIGIQRRWRHSADEQLAAGRAGHAALHHGFSPYAALRRRQSSTGPIEGRLNAEVNSQYHRHPRTQVLPGSSIRTEDSDLN